MTHKSIYFYGNKVSDYGIENKRVDYQTLAKCFDAVMNNDIITNTNDIGYWEQISGGVDCSKIEELQEQIEELEEKQCEMIEEDKEETPEYKALENKIEELQEQIEELENYNPDIFQYFIVSDNAVEILQEAGEIVFYNETLDMNVWGVTHWGTSWDYVLTDIVLDIEEVEQ